MLKFSLTDKTILVKYDTNKILILDIKQSYLRLFNIFTINI
jgi:hypothetical protein